VLRGHRGDAEGAAPVPLLHHPAGAQRHPRRPEPRPPLRQAPRTASRLQARQRQRLTLHQYALPTLPYLLIHAQHMLPLHFFFWKFWSLCLCISRSPYYE
jgi:hypothetical protein